MSDATAANGAAQARDGGHIDLVEKLSSRRNAMLLVGVLAALVYANSLPNQFAYDDRLIIETNTSIQSLETLPGALVRPYWPGDYGRELGLWRPVTTLTLGLQYAVGSGSPFPFHLTNVSLHVVASLLVLALLFHLLSAPAALAGGLVFAVHPLHVEAVANVVGLSELISAVAILAACLVHLRSGERSSWRSALAVGLFYLVGFGSKESAVTLPGLIFVLDAARRDVGVRDIPAYLVARWKTYAVMLAVAVALLVARFNVLGSIASPFAPIGAEMLEEIPRIWTLGEVWTHYVRLWVFPLDLAADYSPGVIPISTGWHVANALGVGMAVLVLGLAAVAWRRPTMHAGRNTGRAAGFGVIWFLVAISPISNTLFLSGVLLAERTLYLPSVGLAAATGWLVVRLAQDRRRLAWGGLVAAVLLSSVRVTTRNPEWRDNSTMFTAMIRDYPHAGRSQWVLGDVLLMRGQVSQALLAYRAAINQLGTHYQLLTDISQRLMEQELYPTAESLLGFAARDQPEFPRAFGMLALVRAEFGDAVGAEAYAREALARQDFDPTRHHLLAWALAAQGRFDEAAEARAEGLEQGRAVFWQQYVYEAYTLREAGDTASALQAVDSAWSRVFTEYGRIALDSVRVAEFGLETLLDSASATGFAPDGL